MSLIGRELIDYSAGVPSAAVVQADGYAGALRYVSPPRAAWMTGKPLTRAEADDYKAHGLIIVSNWQFGKGGPDTSDWIRGWNGGIEDCHRAQVIHNNAGGPPDAPIFPSIDAAPTSWEWHNQVKPYLEAWQSILGRQRMGVYCNPYIIDQCLEAGIGTYYWEHGWGGNKDAPPHPASHIKQFRIDADDCDGVAIDRNRIYKDPFGQWGADGAIWSAILEQQIGTR